MACWNRCPARLPGGHGAMSAFRTALFTTALLCAAPGASLAPSPGDASRRAGDPPPSGLRELWVLPHDRMSPAEQLLAQTLQGLLGRKQPRIWLRSSSMYAVIEDQLRRDGVELHEAASIWEILPRFRSEIKGMVVCRLGTPSINAATSLCGIMDGVAVDESLLERARAQGLKLLVDARAMDERQVFERYRRRFARGVLVEQSVRKPGHLRDFAVARRAFTYATTDPGFRTEVAHAFGPQAVVYGWGDDEYRWVSGISRANASGGPADWCLNLSALQALPAGPLQRRHRPVLATEDGMRTVAFVMSDGDNLQWLCGNFVCNPSYWASPLRGQFPMTWELSPLLAAVGPRVLQHLYATAKETDGFVAGAGAPGYSFPHLQPDPAALARQAAPLLRRADLSVVSVLNANEGRLSETAPILDLPGVQGVLYKDYSPYNRHQGQIFWRRGKPCVSYRFVLWERLMEPEELAREVAKMPAAPRADEASYALVNVHAWSFRDRGGPLEAVRRTIALLPPHTRVVTADQLIALVRANFGMRHAAQ
jgi:putative glycoside hydrolase with GxGYxYP motif/GxGYxY motif-containing protein